MTYGVLRLHANDIKNAAAHCYNAAESRNIDECRKAAMRLQQDLDDFFKDIREIEAIISNGEEVK